MSDKPDYPREIAEEFIYQEGMKPGEIIDGPKGPVMIVEEKIAPPQPLNNPTTGKTQ